MGVSHLHLNPRDVLEDSTSCCPSSASRSWPPRGASAGWRNSAYSFMGYQGFPPDTAPLAETYGPQVAGELKAQGAGCVLLVPA